MSEVKGCMMLKSSESDVSSAIGMLRKAVLLAMIQIGRPCTPSEISDISGIPRCLGSENLMNDAIVTGVLVCLMNEGWVERGEPGSTMSKKHPNARGWQLREGA